MNIDVKKSKNYLNLDQIISYEHFKYYVNRYCINEPRVYNKREYHK